MRKSIEKILWALIGAAGLLSFTDNASALIVHDAPIEDLLIEADRIVYGTVVRKRAERRERGDELWTVYEIVLRSPAGHALDASDFVEVYLPGGASSGITRRVPGIPDLPVGTRAWWLLESVHGAWVPIGYRLGILRPSAVSGGALAHGYVHVNTLDGAPIRWAQPCLTWHLDMGDFDAIARPDVEAALEPAFAVWNEVADAYPRWQFAGAACSDGVGLETAGARNVVIFRTTEASWLHPQRVIALTSVTVDDNSGFITDADVELNAATQRLAVDGAPDAFDLRQVATHEVGHMLGLDHTPVSEAVMFRTTLVGERDNYDLHPDDADGLRASHPLSAVAAPVTCSPVAVSSVEAPYCPQPAEGCATAHDGDWPLGTLLGLAMVMWLWRRWRRACCGRQGHNNTTKQHWYRPSSFPGTP